VSARKERILVAMSGGVDSSVAAALLVETGHEVVGATMRTFCYSGTVGQSKTCCGLDGILDARAVARRLGVAHHVFDVEAEFTRDVVDDFVSEYARGRTPNPCVRCNSFTKFGDLLRRAADLGCTAIASGHYARVVHGPAGAELHRGVDGAKDQAYFLWGLPASLVRRLHLPLGELTKPEVRARARALGLATAEKPESQEICFVPTGDYRDLLRRRLPGNHPAFEPGPIVTSDGAVVGMHDGYAGFTVGQRKGLGGGASEPRFVLEVRPDTRTVVVGPRAALLADVVEVEDPRWLGPPASAGDAVAVQLRHRARAVEAQVQRVDADRLELLLAAPQPAITPGQSAVLFAESRVLGGGRIAGSGRAPARQSSGCAVSSSSRSCASGAVATSASTSDLSPSIS
jgi:tRNA-specific 2-thiouridylase